MIARIEALQRCRTETGQRWRIDLEFIPDERLVSAGLADYFLQSFDLIVEQIANP
jgi:hypothetical protein